MAKNKMLDKFINMMHIEDVDGDSDYYDEYDEYDDGMDEPAPAKEPSNVSSFKEEASAREVKKTVSPAKAMPTPMKSKKAGNGMEVCVIKPTSIDDGREITDTLLANRTVVLNLEGLDVDIAQRIIDFTSGSCYAIRGNLQKISHYIFIITPPSVDISGDFQEIFGAGLGMGSNN